MKRLLALSLLALLCVAGCSSKAQRDAELHAAFLAGQQSAQTSPNTPPPITILGDVRFHQFLWSEGLTLSRAILQAEYLGRRDPRTIFVVRRGERFPVAPAALLRGQSDPPLEPGDIVELQP